MSLKSLVFKAVVFAVLTFSMTIAVAQYSGQGGQGVQELETHKGEISLDNLNVHLDIPFVHKKGVGVPFSLGMHFNNNFWVQNTTTNGASVYWVPNALVWGWLPDAAQMTGSLVAQPFYCTSGGTNYNELYFYNYIDPNGNSHSIQGPAIVGQTTAGPPSDVYCPQNANLNVGQIADNSGYTVILAYPSAAPAHFSPFPATGTGTSTVVLPDGTTVTPGITYLYQQTPWPSDPHLSSSAPWALPSYFSGTSIKDLDQNQILLPAQESWSTYGISPAGPYTYTDTLNVGEVAISPEVFRGVPNSIFYGASGPAGPCASSGTETYTYPTALGNESVTVTCTGYTIQTNFGCNIKQGNGQYVTPVDFPRVVTSGSYTAYLISQITFEDGSFYSFAYESQVSGTITGRLASVTYPDTHTVSYTYFIPASDTNPPGSVQFSQGTSCYDGTVLGLIRTDNTGTWTYSRNITAGVTTVVGPAPAHNTSVYIFDVAGGYSTSMVLTEELDFQNAVTSSPLNSLSETAGNVVTIGTSGNTAVAGDVVTLTYFPQNGSGFPENAGIWKQILTVKLIAPTNATTLTFIDPTSQGAQTGITGFPLPGVLAAYLNCSTTKTLNCLQKHQVLCYGGNLSNCNAQLTPAVYPVYREDIFTNYAGQLNPMRTGKSFDIYGNNWDTDTWDFGSYQVESSSTLSENASNVVTITLRTGSGWPNTIGVGQWIQPYIYMNAAIWLEGQSVQTLSPTNSTNLRNICCWL